MANKDFIGISRSPKSIIPHSGGENLHPEKVGLLIKGVSFPAFSLGLSHREQRYLENLCPNAHRGAAESATRSSNGEEGGGLRRRVGRTWLGHWRQVFCFCFVEISCSHFFLCSCFFFVFW